MKTSINKEEVLKGYKESKSNYLNNMNNENWMAYCNAKRECMLLGIRI